MREEWRPKYAGAEKAARDAVRGTTKFSVSPGRQVQRKDQPTCQNPESDMADKDDGGGKSGRKAEKDTKAPKVLKPTNLSKLTKELADFLEQMDAKKDDQEKVNGEYAVDIGNLKETFANKTGHSRATLTKLYAQHRALRKLEKWRKEAEKVDVDAFDEVMAASEGIKDTPLFRAAREKMVGADNVVSIGKSKTEH